MKEPVWISKKAVLSTHREQILEHGGLDGTRDESLLDSALAKPHNIFAYTEDPSIFDLAAAYAFGIAPNHAFIDGNKRTALAISITFLDRNGWDLDAPMVDIYLKFLNLAEGALTLEELSAWFFQHAIPLEL